MSTKVDVGISSVLGWLTFVAGEIPLAVKLLESGQQALASPEKYAAIAGVIAGGITQIGRYLQAHAKAKAIATTKSVTAPGAVLPPVS